VVIILGLVIKWNFAWTHPERENISPQLAQNLLTSAKKSTMQ